MKLVSLLGVFESSSEYVDQMISDTEPSVEESSSFPPLAAPGPTSETRNTGLPPWEDPEAPLVWGALAAPVA